MGTRELTADVVVVGAGISGLTAATRLVERPPPRAASAGMASIAACGRAEPGEQLEVGDRADIVRPDQPQPGDAVGRRRHQAASRPTLGSVPPTSRAMLVRCFQSTSKAKPRNRMARSKRPRSAAVDRRRKRGDHAGERGIAGQTPAPGSRERRRPGSSASAARRRSRPEVATPLPPLKPQPDRLEVAEKRADPGQRRELRLIGPDQPGRSTAAAPLATSSSRVAAARPLRPVRSTLVAPILPEPIVRRPRRPPPGSAASRTGSSPAHSRAAGTGSAEA